MVPSNNGSQVVNQHTSVSQSQPEQSIHVREVREYQSVREVTVREVKITNNEGDDGSSKQIAKK